MKTDLADNHPDIKLVDTVYGDDDDQTSFDKTAALLQTHPDLKGIISPTTVGIAAAARYLSDLGRQGQGRADRSRARRTRCATTSRTAPSPRSRCGTRATSATSPRSPPRRSSTATSPARRATPSTAGDLGDFTVGADGVVLLGDPFKFNADNIDDFDF